MKTGDRLSNGAQIISAKAIETSDNHLQWVVLANNGGFEPFVTWVVDSQGHAHWGHYYQEVGEAAFDFDNRVTSYQGRNI